MMPDSSFAIAPGSPGTSVQLALSRRAILARYRQVVGESDDQGARSSADKIRTSDASESHFETPHAVPLWDGITLLPVFVAQVIAQSMPPGGVTTAQAYERPTARRGGVVDLKG